MRKIMILSAMTTALSLPAAFADSLNIENPDNLEIKITYGSEAITTSENERLYLDINPAGNNEIVLNVDAIDLNKKLISSAAAGAGGSTGCNYSMIVSKKFGWKLNGFGKNCSKSEDHYTPQQPAVYTFINNSSHPVYVAFDQSSGFAPDSIEGWLKPGHSRMYDENTAYWQYQGIKRGDEIRTAVFDGNLQKYKECSLKFEPVNESKTYSYNSEHTCNIYAFTINNRKIVAARYKPLSKEEFLVRTGASSSEGRVTIDLSDEKFNSLFYMPGTYSIPLKAGNSMETVELKVIADSTPPW